METEKLIGFIKEIQHGRIPPETIVELADNLINKLELLSIDKVSVPAAGTGCVYIAGDIASLDREWLMRRYTDAENLLKLHKHKPINPLTLIPEGTGWQASMRICLNALINNCSYIALFADWNRSKDAQSQYLIASSLGYNVIRL